MRTSLFIIIVILSVNVCLGSCFGPKYSVTEILANEEDAHHVFTCTIIATYCGDDGYTSLALVNKIYRGNLFLLMIPS